MANDIANVLLRKIRTLPLRIATLSLILILPMGSHAQSIEGKLIQWHRVTLSFDGPFVSETDSINPFSDYRLDVTFIHDNQVITIPGFYAADGNASETSAEAGNIWRVHFTPMYSGPWEYHASFLGGRDIAIEDGKGVPVLPHGTNGALQITEADDSPVSRGHLKYVGQRYLQYRGTGEYFLKIGADAPETFLAYEDFDGTSVQQGGFPLKSWSPHIADWLEGDPMWQDDRGKGIIGAINYLADQQQNAFSFLTMNINGDGKNVWPYIDPGIRDRFDCSKLDQWEVVFEHADQHGMFLHFKTQETENDQLLDGGSLGRERRLYYRELIARFGHHLALNWNLGEENTNTAEEIRAYAEYIDSLDVYDHPIVVHTFPNQDDTVYDPLIGNLSGLTGASIQTDWANVHARTKKWVRKTSEAQKPWIISNDEQGSAVIGVPHDQYAGIDPDQHDIRKQVLWGNLMAGGAGVEYYFGYALPHSDLSCEDFRSRENMWNYNRIAHDFFTQHVPFWAMESADHMVSSGNFCLADGETTILVYLQDDTSGTVDLSGYTGAFSVAWFDPMSGGDLLEGSITQLVGGGNAVLGSAPGDRHDWAVLIKKDGTGPSISQADIAPVTCHVANVILQFERPDLVTGVSIERSLDGQNFEVISPLVIVDPIDARASLPVETTARVTWYRLTPYSQAIASVPVVIAYHQPTDCKHSSSLQQEPFKSKQN